MSWRFERVAGPFGTTEGPVWDGEGVLFTDMPSSRVMRYDATTGDCGAYRTGTNNANGLKFGPDGGLYACEMGGRRVVRYEADGGVTVVADEYEGGRLNSTNDLAFDAAGRLWFTDPFYDTSWVDHGDDLDLDHRSVYRADPTDDWALARTTYDTTNPNGLLVSPDDGTLYVAQSRYGEGNPRELRAYPIEGDDLGPYEVLHDFYPHRGVDGMCLDEEGNVVATAGYEEGGPGPMLYVFTPSGRVLETHPVPDPRPTNCCFGGDDLRTLYLTGYDGCLYRAETDRRGYLGAP
ncbi:SMP-30/gluconolactonase/LRE family protein [Halomarina pelagica]|uniref:SMP-30/gluconolactonase/LRE family protein n=1 Tax=Halomarina pelagica TaxID=2961599 RepID=UPI0020C44116|nr:SMP-30/gluconolactonase/LRE family protein [Halomarina sp. BND7]